MLFKTAKKCLRREDLGGSEGSKTNKTNKLNYLTMAFTYRIRYFFVQYFSFIIMKTCLCLNILSFISKLFINVTLYFLC